MPWKESSVLDERIRFVIRHKDGEDMSSLCREFGISRKTRYKIIERYEQCGFDGLSDRSRRPIRYANQLPPQVEAGIVKGYFRTARSLIIIGALTTKASCNKATDSIAIHSQ